MTASDLHAMVSKWPESARADDCRYVDPGDGCDGFKDSEGFGMSDAHAVSLHEISGLRWLIEKSMQPVAIKSHVKEGSETEFVVEYAIGWNDQDGRGPTLISAIDAAIRAVEGEEK